MTNVVPNRYIWLLVYFLEQSNPNVSQSLLTTQREALLWHFLFIKQEFEGMQLWA